MIYDGKSLELLSDDGNGSRLWIDRATGKVANESYDFETGESFGLDGEIEQWGYSDEDSLV